MNKSLRAKRMRRKGMSYEDIGAKLGCTKQRVWQLLASLGEAGEIGLKQLHPKVDDKKLLSLVQGDVSRIDVAKQLHVCPETVGRRLKKLGIAKWRQPTEEEVRAKFVRPEPFGRLTVKDVKHNAVGWWAKCECACGKRRTVECYNLEHGRTQSCGCLRKDHMSKVGKARRKTA